MFRQCQVHRNETPRGQPAPTHVGFAQKLPARTAPGRLRQPATPRSHPPRHAGFGRPHLSPHPTLWLRPKACDRDIFSLRDALVDDYKSFTGSFVQPRDEGISAFLERRLAAADQWPDPWLSLNPSFATGGTPGQLAAAGPLDQGCEPIFQVKENPDDPRHAPIIFHRHQRDAIEAARSDKSYVMTTGTGSGKLLGYIVPIVDRVVRERSTSKPGVKAIVVYPMNALANSQVEELRKFLCFGFSPQEKPVSFARYTGQERPDERQKILANRFQNYQRISH